MRVTIGGSSLAVKPTQRFEVKDFVQRLAQLVRDKPALAPTAYARAASRLRAEASTRGSETERAQLHVLAGSIEQMIPAVGDRAGGNPATSSMLAPLETASVRMAYPHDPRVADLRGRFADDIQSITEYQALVARQIESKASEASELEAAWRETEIERVDRRAEHDLGGQTTPASAIPGRTLFSQSAYIQYGDVAQQGSPGNFDPTGVPSTKQEAQVCRWDGNEEETQSVSVCISPSALAQNATFPRPSNPASVPYSYRPFFHVFWGTSRGQPQEAIGDIGRGVQFSVAGCYLNVNVGMDPPLAGAISGSMLISGTFGFQPAGVATNVIRTRYVDNLAAGATRAGVTIPNFASTLLPILRTDVSGGASVTLNFRDAAGTLLYSFTLTGSTQQTQPIALTGDANTIDVINSGTLTSSFHLCFTLAL